MELNVRTKRYTLPLTTSSAGPILPSLLYGRTTTCWVRLAHFGRHVFSSQRYGERKAFLSHA